MEENITRENTSTMQHQPFLKKWGGLVILALALAIIIIDTTLLNVSLRTIITDLDTDLKSMQWVITIYSLILAAFTITGGRLGDFFGRKKMFLVGAIIFAIGSFIASISKNIGMMIAGEAIIEGIGAALMMPATASLLITNFKGRDRSIAFGVWGGIAAASSAIGPILGGWLTTNYSWRWGFRINIVVVAIVLLGSFLIKENERGEKTSRIDFVGIILSSLGLLSMVFGFIQASTYGWFKAKEQLVLFSHSVNLGSLSATPIFIALGLIILTLFIFWEKHYEKTGHTPLLSLQLFKNNQFVAGASTMAVLALGQAGLFFTVPVFLQAVRHLDALHTGLTLLPMSLALLIGAPLSAFLIKFVRPKWLIQAGLILSVIGFIVLRATLNADATGWDLAPGFIIFGFGMGLIMAQVSNLTLSAVSVSEAGEASGVNNTLRMVGQTLGSAILGAVLLSALISNSTEGVRNSQTIPVASKPNIEAGISSRISDISFGVEDQTQATQIPDSIRNELTRITTDATVKANKTVMLYGMFFVLMGLLVSTRLPNVKDAHGEIVPEEKDTAESTENESTPVAIGMIAAAAVDKEQMFESEIDMQEQSKISPDRSYKKLYIALAIAAIVVGILAIIHYAKDSDENKPKPEVVTDENISTESPRNTLTPPTTNENSNNANIGASDNTNSNSNSGQQSMSPRTFGTYKDIDTEANSVSTPPQPVPVSTSQTNSMNYSHQNLHFAFEMPTNWKVVKNSNGEVVFKTGSAMYNVQSTYAPNGDWGSLREFLEQQPNISNVQRVMFGSRDVFKFDIQSSYLSGYAFLENGRLYYVLGEGSERTPLVNLKTF
jgi:EmrB/QacA subfamily drug resistance transporter